MRLVNVAENYLESLNMKVNSEWLEGCVEFFCEETKDGRVDNEALYDMVKTQWLLADLREMCPGCLPSNLNNQLKTTLNGTYVLQMNYLINIGTPAYQQLQKIQKVDTMNIEVTDTNTSKPSSQRMLKLILTDGVQEISGIEYKPIRNFYNNLIPGIKIQIKGPVDCRRGVLMLEEKHVTVLGGEVEDLLEKNNQKNVLKRMIDCNDDSESRPAINFTREILNMPKNITPARHNIQKNTQPSSNLSGEDLDLNMDMFEDENFDLGQLDELENRVIKNGSCKRSFPIEIEDDVHIIDEPSTSYSNNRQNKRVRMNDTYENDFVDFETCLMDSKNEESMEDINQDKKIVDYPIKVNRDPFVYIKQLLKLSVELKNMANFIVKGQISKVVGKLSFQKRIWVLRCTIIDGSGAMDVNISSDLLSDIIGYTPQEMIGIKKQIGSTPSLKDTVIEKLNLAMDRIQILDCLFRIAYEDDGPYIIEISELTGHHEKQLKDRLSEVKKHL